MVLNAVHANVPDKEEPSLKKGWFDHYWNPMKHHLAVRKLKELLCEFYKFQNL